MFRFHHSVPRARVFAKDFRDFFKISEGLGHFPTSKKSPSFSVEKEGFYGKGYSFPMLAIQLFFLRKLHPVVDIFPARISQYDSSVVGFARLWGIELFHIYLAGL